MTTEMFRYTAYVSCLIGFWSVSLEAAEPSPSAVLKTKVPNEVLLPSGYLENLPIQSADSLRIKMALNIEAREGITWVFHNCREEDVTADIYNETRKWHNNGDFEKFGAGLFIRSASLKDELSIPITSKFVCFKKDEEVGIVSLTVSGIGESVSDTVTTRLLPHNVDLEETGWSWEQNSRQEGRSPLCNVVVKGRLRADTVDIKVNLIEWEFEDGEEVTKSWDFREVTSIENENGKAYLCLIKATPLFPVFPSAVTDEYSKPQYKRIRVSQQIDGRKNEALIEKAESALSSRDQENVEREKSIQISVNEWIGSFFNSESAPANDITVEAGNGNLLVYMGEKSANPAFNYYVEQTGAPRTLAVFVENINEKLVGNGYDKVTWKDVLTHSGLDETDYKAGVEFVIPLRRK